MRILQDSSSRYIARRKSLVLPPFLDMNVRCCACKIMALEHVCPSPTCRLPTVRYLGLDIPLQFTWICSSFQKYMQSVCVSSEQICSNYWVYYLLSFSGYFLLSYLLTYSLFSLNVQIVCCAGDLFSLLGSFEPGCHVLCDLSHMAYCNLFIAVFYVRCHEDVRLKCCFDSKIVFLCTCCFDSKIMKISQQYIWVKYLFSNFLCLKLYCAWKGYSPTDDVVVELFILV